MRHGGVRGADEGLLHGSTPVAAAVAVVARGGGTASEVVASRGAAPGHIFFVFLLDPALDPTAIFSTSLLVYINGHSYLTFNKLTTALLTGVATLVNNQLAVDQLTTLPGDAAFDRSPADPCSSLPGDIAVTPATLPHWPWHHHHRARWHRPCE